MKCDVLRSAAERQILDRLTARRQVVDAECLLVAADRNQSTVGTKSGFPARRIGLNLQHCLTEIHIPDLYLYRWSLQRALIAGGKVSTVGAKSQRPRGKARPR